MRLVPLAGGISRFKLPLGCHSFLLSLEDLHEFPITSGNLFYCLGPGDFVVTPVYQRVPEARPSDRETNKAGNCCSGSKPFANLGTIFAPAEDNTTYVFSTLQRLRGQHFKCSPLCSVR